MRIKPELWHATEEAAKAWLMKGVKILDNGCWEWQRSKASIYGIAYFNGKAWPVHRYMWAVHNGGESALIKGMNICHRCNYKKCCNPEHLYQGTDSDNMADISRLGQAKHFKLNPEKVWDIRANAKIGDVESMRAMAKKYEISKEYVYLIITRRAWKAV